MRGKSYFKNVLSEAEDMYSNASGRRSAFRGQAGGEIGGCTDVTASNFLPQATCDDGSCDYSNYGCTQTWASNYDPSAEYDDGSCLGDVPDNYYWLYLQQYAQPSDPIPSNPCPLLGGGGGIGGLMCYFQSDFGAYGDFEPPFSPYSGCTDSRADNFNPDACYEDMSCSFSGPYAEVYSQEYLMSASQCQFVCSTTSGGSTTGGGIVDSAFGTGKDPKGRGKGTRKRRGMRSATGGGKRSVGTAVNWLTPLI